MSKWIVTYKDDLVDDEVIEAKMLSFQYPGMIALQNAEKGGMVAIFNLDAIVSIKAVKEQT